MSPSRLLPLWLLAAALSASACSTDTTNPDGETLDAGDGDGDGKADTGTIGDGDVGDGDGDLVADAGGDGDGDMIDSGSDACVPKGCEEQGFTCGMATDGCGGELSCEPSSGDPCVGFDTCGGDATKPNQCGCTPKTCADLGVACGTDLDDGCGGKIDTCGAGDCLGVAANYICASDKSACQCVPLSENIVCEQHECGGYSNGCDMNIDCGSCSAFKTCVAGGGGTSSTCQCDINNATKKAQACGAKTCGTATTADGCTYSCGAACVTTCAAGGNCAAAQNCSCPNDGAGPGADQVCYNNTCCTQPANAAAACGSQLCGEVTVCGVVYKCGNQGACTDTSKGCSLPLYNKAVSVPTCIDKKTADLLGTYRVRTHSFRGTNNNGILINRAESLSFVTIENDASNQLHMRDYGCFTTGMDIKGGNPSIAPSYYNLPELKVDLSVAAGSPATWLRPAKSIAAGFINSRPSDYFCSAAGAFTGAGNAAVDYNTEPGFLGPAVTPESGARKSWLGGSGTPPDERANQACTCPANGADYGAMPAENTGSSTSGVTDCRINDVDDDDKPGFSIIAKSGGVTLNVAAASLATTEWWGNVDPSGRHYGFGAISASHNRDIPLSRKFLSCGGSFGAGLLCIAAPTQQDWGCGSQYDLVRFERLPANTHYDTFAALKEACAGAGKYYTNAPATAVGQAKTKAGEFGFTTTCATYNDCRADETCKAGKCWPLTSPEVCDKTTAPCRPGWQCADTDHSCWPATCTDPTP